MTKKTKIKKTNGDLGLGILLTTLVILCIILTVYIAYCASFNGIRLFSVGLVSLFAGLLFESFRIGDDWKTVLSVFTASYFFSFIGFLPGKHEHKYVFEDHLVAWPYYFLILYAIFFVVIHKNKVTFRLTEGTTLLLSLSLIYWTIDYGFFAFNNWFAITLLSIVILFCAFSFLHALTYIHLTKRVRLALSVWSSVIMFAFALDNIIRVFNNPVESTSHLPETLYVGIQYFLLGVSALYIMQNYMLLAAFLPSKNSNYADDLRENKKDHVDRYSDKQFLITHSLICIAYAGSIYWLNYRYKWLPHHTIIWFVFLSFQLIFGRSNKVNDGKAYRNISMP